MSSIFNNLYENLKSMSPIRLIVSSFAFIILIGTILLSLPISTRNGTFTPVIDSFFVATSATCVTGLTLFDTYTQWSNFGQVVIILLIQFGALGLITFTTGFTLFFRKKWGLRDIRLAKEYTSGSVIDTPKLIKTILIWSLVCESIGAVLLAIRFIPQFGAYGIWISIFTAISAYCNAGFDLMGFTEKGIGLINYRADALVSLTIGLLIVIGGIGFVVISDIHSGILKKVHDKRSHFHLNFHSMIVIKMTVALLLIGTLFFFIFEYNNTLSDLDFSGKLVASFFQSSSARTAGFFSLPIGSEREITKLLTIFLMFIGASPASTGGGIKTTTFAVLLATVKSIIKGNEDTVFKGHKVEKSTVYRALAIITMAFTIVSFLTVAISLIEESQNIHIVDIVLEVVSAFATVGLTAGITTLLSDLSKVLLSIAMFIGRVGPISLGIAITLNKNRAKDRILPYSKIIVG